LEKWISRNIEFTSNGQVVCHSSSEYITHLDKYRKAYSSLEIINLMDEPLVADNKAIINYDVDLFERKTNKKIQVAVMAIATIEDSKITHWNQVANEKNTSHWNS
jgi:limonene-1,2-epoxide hydrolase